MEQETEYYWYTYICKPPIDLRGRRFKVTTSTPCGFKQILQARHQITESSNTQAKCPNCGNRPRLKPRDVELHETLREANKAKVDWNRPRRQVV